MEANQELFDEHAFRELFDEDKMLNDKLGLVRCIPKAEQDLLQSLKNQGCRQDNIEEAVKLAHKYGVAPRIVVREVERLLVVKPDKIDYQQLWDLGWPRRPLDWPAYQEESRDLLKCLAVVEPEQAKREFVREVGSKLETPRLVTLNEDFGTRTSLFHDRLDLYMDYPECEYVNCKSLAFYTVGDVGDVYFGQVSDMKALTLLGKLPTDECPVCDVNYDKTLLCLASSGHVGVLSLKHELHTFEVFCVACQPRGCEFVGKSNLLSLCEPNQVTYFDACKKEVVARVARVAQSIQAFSHATSKGVLGVYLSYNGYGSLALFGLDTNVADTNLPGILNGGAASKACIVPTKDGFELRDGRYGQVLSPSINLKDFMDAS